MRVSKKVPKSSPGNTVKKNAGAAADLVGRTL